MIKRICIINEDLSGWLTALYILSNTNSKVTLIQKEFKSSEVESIHPKIVEYLFESDLGLDDWMPKTSAAFRYGIGLHKWGWNTELQSFSGKAMRLIDSERTYNFGYDRNGNGFTILDAVLSNRIPAEGFMNWQPSRMLAINCISPIRGIQKLDYDTDRLTDPFHGVHWDTKKMYNVLKEKCLENDRFLLIEDGVNEDLTREDNSRISTLTTAKGISITTDYIFDGVGILLNDYYNVEWESYDFLPNNSIMTFRKDYGDPLIECKPYSKMTIATRGYTMTLPLHDQNTFHYCYNNNWSEDDIKTELVNFSRAWNQDPVVYNFACGRSEHTFHKNVCGIGTVAGNVDPLYGLNYIPTILLVERIVASAFDETLHCEGENWIQKEFDLCMDEISSFTAMPFAIVDYQATDYWKRTKTVKYPDKLNQTLDIAKRRPIRDFELDEIFGWNMINTTRTFFEHHYFEFMHGLQKEFPSVELYYHAEGDQNGTNIDIDGRTLADAMGYYWDEIDYMAMCLEKWKWNISKIGESFPPHWWYLNQWYNDYNIIWNNPAEQKRLHSDIGAGGFLQPSMIEGTPVGMYL